MAAFNVIPSRSAAVRSYLESHLLEALAGRQATVALSGFIFFGSSVLLSDKVGSASERHHLLPASHDGANKFPPAALLVLGPCWYWQQLISLWLRAWLPIT
jgi:hypothetical protein